MVPADDEYKDKYIPRSRSSSGSTFPSFRVRVRRSRRVTYFLGAVFLLLIYKLTGYLSTLPLPNDILTGEHDLGEIEDFPWKDFSPMLGGDEESRQNNIVIKFPELYETLGRGSSAGFREINRIILFAASSLQSASKLAGMACDMSLQGQNVVHMVLLGKDDISMELFRKMNGLGKISDCKVQLHDARPENATTFTEAQMQTSVKAAIKHVHRFLHPQAILIDTEHEQHSYLTAVKSRAKQYKITTIELPLGAVENMRWVTKLDSDSLKDWHTPKYEILIHADKHNGNLIRLLKSLRNANYFGILPSKLTIEFDPSIPIHPFIRKFLTQFNWPSRDRLSVRYPVLEETDNVRKAIHFVDTFYPPDMSTGILLLDVNAELSPYYMHWLHYATLEYRYSKFLFSDTTEISGISLTAPRSLLNDTPFEPNMQKHTPFLYSAPSTDAILYFPRHWVQFHAYFRRRMQDILNLTTIQESDSQSSTKTSPNMTIPNINLSEQIKSSWLLYFIELIQARSFLILYPTWGLDISMDKGYSNEDVMAIIHDEEPSYTRSNDGTRSNLGNEKHLLNTNTFLEMLPDGILPAFSKLPIKNLRGEDTDAAALEAEADDYKLQITNNCTDRALLVDWLAVNDLFCDGTGNNESPNQME